MTFKKSIIALALLGSSTAFAQTASYSTATFTWNRTVNAAVTSQATTNVALHQGVDGVLSASGGVTFSAGQSLQQLTAADARSAYQTFANSVYDLVKTNVTAVRSAVTSYDTASTALGGTTIGAETLTIGAGGVTGSLNAGNNATLYGARDAVRSAMNTLHTNIGTANTSLESARDAINSTFASTETMHIDGTASWNALQTNATLANVAPMYHKVISAAGTVAYYRIIAGTGGQSPQFHSVGAGDSATWVEHGVLNAPITQFQQVARQF